MERYKMTTTKRPLPFDCIVIDKEPVEVANRFNPGDTVTLPPDAVAVYDVILGALATSEWEYVAQGKDWFRTYEPEAYMILLD